MFEGNWMVFVLILILVFSGGGIVGTELVVLIAAVLAIVLSEGGCLGNLFNCPSATT